MVGGVAPGDVVYQRFVGYGWHRGTVTAPSRKQPGYFIVEYEDGDRRELSEVEVRKWMPPQAHAVGARIEAQWPPRPEGFTAHWLLKSDQDCVWYGATVTKVEGAGTDAEYSLLYDDGSKATGVGAAHVSPYVALENQTPAGIASQLLISLPQLLADNCRRYKGLAPESKLKAGTLLVLQPDPAADVDSHAQQVQATGGNFSVKAEQATLQYKHASRQGASVPRDASKRKSPKSRPGRRELATKRQRTQNASAGTTGSSTVRSGSAPCDQVQLEQFWRYVYRRQCVRAEMYPETLTLLPGETEPKTFIQRPLEVPHDPILGLVKTGNVYRALDELGNKDGGGPNAWEAQNAALDLDLDACIPGTQPKVLPQALGFCLLFMGAFNKDRKAEWASSCAASGMPGCRTAAGAAATHLPCSIPEIRHFSSWLARKAGVRLMFAGAQYQVQSVSKWLRYLKQWLDPKCSRNLENTATRLCPLRPMNLIRLICRLTGCNSLQTHSSVWDRYNSRSWTEANQVVTVSLRLHTHTCCLCSLVLRWASERLSTTVRQSIAGIGNFTGAQGLLRLLYGLFRGKTELLFCADFDTDTMMWECKFGNGPIAVIKGKPGRQTGLWNGKKDVLEGIQWLVANAEREFDRLGLQFPYLPEESCSAGGKWARKPMTAIDMEHSLCYFSRLLRARKTFASKPELLQRLHDLILPMIKDRRVYKPSFAGLLMYHASVGVACLICLLGNRTVPRRSMKEFSQLAVPVLSSDDRYVQIFSSCDHMLSHTNDAFHRVDLPWRRVARIEALEWFKL